MVFITKNEAKLDEYVCSNWLKTTLKTPKKIFPIQSADAHKTINNTNIPHRKVGELARDRWNATHDTWHRTPEKWQVTNDTQKKNIFKYLVS